MERTPAPAVRGGEPDADTCGNAAEPQEPSTTRTGGRDESEALWERPLPWQAGPDRGSEPAARAESAPDAAGDQSAGQVSRQRDAGAEHGTVPAQQLAGGRLEGGEGRLARLLARGGSQSYGRPAEPGGAPAPDVVPDAGEPERDARISGAVVAVCVLLVFGLTVGAFLAFPGESGEQVRAVNPATPSADDMATEEGMSGGSPSATSRPTPGRSGATSRGQGPAVASGTASAPTPGGKDAAASDSPEAVTGATAKPGTAKPGKAATTPSTAVGRMIVGYGSSRCVEVTAHDDTDGSPLRLWDCDGDAWQKWAFRSDGSVRSMGLCMDIANASTANGATIQLARCNGGWAQRFTVDSTHGLVNAQAGKCVDVTDSATGNGARLQLWDCAGTSNQKWYLR
ncbi:ricin-type beta-trefoil lectin domain protein [Streptomyces lunaelactis]|uniref:RICIN domain-containing protein n=1 Tax=Streptomyces lunaelactis TaxID=1535768 RepID=UPI00158563C5|nr:RICIN domain-containing protein [Streptomyces lunaelactis]NUL06010.1 ricin-type beta-trefoil lectin domain protein [Streptomyces lunaelactis]